MTTAVRNQCKKDTTEHNRTQHNRTEHNTTQHHSAGISTVIRADKGLRVKLI